MRETDVLCGGPCQAQIWHSLLYFSIGLCAVIIYLALSIVFYIECYALDESSLWPIQCGSTAMWSCMGWVPLFFFTAIILFTFSYLYRQSFSTIKVVNASEAWLILFVAVACCVLFVIHIGYIAYICMELVDNPTCDAQNELADLHEYNGQKTVVDCDYATQLISALLFFAVTLILFVCASLGIIFALVNGRIATPVNYKTVKQAQHDDVYDEQKDAHSCHVDEEDGDGEEEEDEQKVHVQRDGVRHTEENKEEQAERTRLQQRVENLAAHKLGDRVIVALSYSNNEGCYGTVKWYGAVKATEYPTESSTSLPFLYGVLLDAERGNSDGTLRDRRVFRCRPGFGVFVPPNHIKALPPDQDPLRNQDNSSKANTKSVRIPWDGAVISKRKSEQKEESEQSAVDNTRAQRHSVNMKLVITREQEANHLYSGQLFFFLRTLDFVGIVQCTKIGCIDFSEKPQAINTKCMMSVIFPRRNDTIYSYLPLLSETSKYDAVFNPERIDHEEEGDDDDDDEDEKKTTEESSCLPAVNLWYLTLHQTWLKHSEKIKALGVKDYGSSQWLRHSEQRALHWYSLLNIPRKQAMHAAKTRFATAPLPLFLKQHSVKPATELSELHENDDMKISQQHSPLSVYSAVCPHYIPLGIFHDKHQDGQQQAAQPQRSKHPECGWLEGPPIPHLFDALNQKIETRLKRLIHEPVEELAHILPYLHAKQYQVDSQANGKYGWFPIGWVYAEVDICDEALANKFASVYLSYTDPFDDENTAQISMDPHSYNPYGFLKSPRIPLFILTVRLPLKQLQQYAVKMVSEKYGAHSSPPLHHTLKQKQKPKPKPKQKHTSPATNTSISIDNAKYDAMGNLKKAKRAHKTQQAQKERKKRKEAVHSQSQSSYSHQPPFEIVRSNTNTKSKPSPSSKAVIMTDRHNIEMHKYGKYKASAPNQQQQSHRDYQARKQRKRNAKKDGTQPKYQHVRQHDEDIDYDEEEEDEYEAANGVNEHTRLRYKQSSTEEDDESEQDEEEEEESGTEHSVESDEDEEEEEVEEEEDTEDEYEEESEESSEEEEEEPAAAITYKRKRAVASNSHRDPTIYKRKQNVSVQHVSSYRNAPKVRKHRD